MLPCLAACCTLPCAKCRCILLSLVLQACWARRGHPGWAILPLDTATFERGCAHLHQVREQLLVCPARSTQRLCTTLQAPDCAANVTITLWLPCRPSCTACLARSFCRSPCRPSWRQPPSRRQPTPPPASWPQLPPLSHCPPAAVAAAAHQPPWRACLQMLRQAPCPLLQLTRAVPPHPSPSSRCAMRLRPSGCRCERCGVAVWLVQCAFGVQLQHHVSNDRQCGQYINCAASHTSVQSPGTPPHPLTAPPAAASPAAPASPFQAASASLPAGAAPAAAEGGSRDGSLAAKLLRSLGPDAAQPQPAQQLQAAVPAAPQRSGAVPLHLQLATSGAGRPALGSSLESSTHLLPSPSASGEAPSPQCGSPFVPSGEPSLTLPGLPEGLAGLGVPQSPAAAVAAAAAAAVAAAAASDAKMVPVPTGAPAGPVHEAPSFDFNAGRGGGAAAAPSASPPLPAAAPLLLPECPPALRRSPTPGLDAALAPAVSACKLERVVQTWVVAAGPAVAPHSASPLCCA